MNETAALTDHVVVLGRGRLLADTPTQDFIEQHSQARVRVRSGDPIRLRATLLARGHTVTEDEGGRWVVEDATAEQIGSVAAREGIPVLELTDERGSLEAAYFALTTAETEFAADPDPDAADTTADADPAAESAAGSRPSPTGPQEV